MTQSVNLSSTAYYINCSLYIFNAIFFIALLKKILTSTEDLKAVKANLWSIITLLSIIILCILYPFGLSELIIDFPSSCYNDQCMECIVMGHSRDFFWRLFASTRCCMIIKILELNVEPYPDFLVLYSKTLTLWIRNALIFGFIVSNVLGMAVFQLEYDVYPINSDIHICNFSMDNEITLRRRRMHTFFATCIAIIHILFCWLMIKQMMKIYECTKTQLITEDYVKTKKNINLILDSTIIPGIRYSVIVVLMLFIHVMFAICFNTGYSDIIATPLMLLFMGLCIILILPIGKPSFYYIFGCFERRIVTKWINLTVATLQNPNKSKSEVKPLKNNRNSISIDILEATPNQRSPPKIEPRSITQEKNDGKEEHETLSLPEVLSQLSSLSPAIQEEMNSNTGTIQSSRYESTASQQIASGTTSIVLEARIALEESTPSASNKCIINH